MAKLPYLSVSRRTRRTPFTPRVEAQGLTAYTVYNHTLLPTVFRSLEEDYWHLRTEVQLWDVGCQRQVEVRGRDAARLVQLMTPRDLSSAAAGQCLYVPLVDETGALLNDPLLLKFAEDRYWLSVSDSDVLLWAKGLALGLGLDVEVTEPDVWILAVQGPKAEELMAGVFGEEVRPIRFFRFAGLPFRGEDLTIGRSGWSKQGGFEIYLHAPESGLALWDALWEAGQGLGVRAGCPNLIERIEGGLLSYGNDMTRDDTPLECALERFCDLDRPIDCLGLESLRNVAAAGVGRLIRGLAIEGDALPACVAPWPVVSGGAGIGQVTSAAQSPRLGHGVAVAMLDRGHWAPGQEVEVKTPDGPRRAQVADLPFPKEAA